jgi:hypothetical protein
MSNQLLESVSEEMGIRYHGMPGGSTGARFIAKFVFVNISPSSIGVCYNRNGAAAGDVVLCGKGLSLPEPLRELPRVSGV